MTSKTWRIAAIIVVVAIAAGGGITWRIKAMNDGKPTIKTAKVERGTVKTTVSATGTLQPYDTTISVKSNVGGTVVKLAVDIGDHVKKGQLIALIDPTDSKLLLEESQADLNAAGAKLGQTRDQRKLQIAQDIEAVRTAEQGVANAQVKLAQAKETAVLQPQLTNSTIRQAEQNLAAAKEKLAQARESAQVQPQLSTEAINDAQSNLAAARAAYQQAKTATDPQKIAAAQAAYDQAKGAFTYAETDLARQKNLLAKGFVPRSTVDTSQQNYATAKAQLDDARATLNTVQSAVDEELRSLDARVKQAQAQLNTAQANRVQDSLKMHDVTAAQADVAQAEAALKIAQDNRTQDQLKRQDVQVAQAALATAISSLNTARAGMIQDKIRAGDIQQAEASVVHNKATVKDATTTLGYCTITAPRDGVVVAKYVEVGSIVPGARSLTGVGQGVSLVDLDDTTRILAFVNVDETDIAQVAVGEAVDVTLDAYPDELFDGKVTKVAPTATIVQNVTTVQVTVEIDMPDARLKPALNVNCVFNTNSRKNVLMLPNEAVHDSDNGASVQVLDHGKPTDHPITTGLQGDTYTEISSGLNEGDEVILSITDSKKATKSGSGGASGGQPRMPRGF